MHGWCPFSSSFLSQQQQQQQHLSVVHSEVSYLVKRRARYKKGIKIQDVSDFAFDEPAQKIMCPTLCVSGEACLQFLDKIGYEGTEQFEAGCQLIASKDRPVESLTGTKSSLNRCPTSSPRSAMTSYPRENCNDYYFTLFDFYCVQKCILILCACAFSPLLLSPIPSLVVTGRQEVLTERIDYTPVSIFPNGVQVDVPVKVVARRIAVAATQRAA